MIARVLKNKILWSTLVQYFGKLLQIALGIITIKLVTQALGPEQYGVYGKIAEYSLFFSTVANLGIFGNVVRKMSENPGDGRLFMNALFLRMATLLPFLGAGVILTLFTFQDKGLWVGVLFFSCSLFFDGITTVCTGLLQANYWMGRSVLVITLSRFLEAGVVLLLLENQAATPLFFLAPLLSAALAMLLSLGLARSKLQFVWKLDLGLLKNLFFTALPFGVINILNSLYYRFLPSFFVAKGLSDAQFGTYNLVLSAISSVALFSTFLMFSSLPALKQSLKEGHTKRAKELYLTLRRGLLTLGILALVSGSLLGPFLLRLISSRDFLPPELWFLLPLFLLLAALSYLYDLVLITLFAMEEEFWFMKRELLALIFGTSIFLYSLLPFTPEFKLFLVLLGAISAEGLMVHLGMRKIKARFLQEHSLSKEGAITYTS